ncbi:UDP-N-acetylglucosamine 2-epimerase (non-hydrolyzing) [Candidatus Synechococcus calcipolaris G9]|uniref:UDP-N-acetylglucosamine 2-epimerase (Non-hydrolyzing) n=1 Tax=Candidatus Synechococcus calcipolaris G9 TaxID=1497997 RepID=A0ABT6EZC5_9SYNE|nr:UDP-N-acetylglucosamine 2-epimerase (non-hydrolyzing) [Candidatus Synechococcus calcipolaris]MDG2990943.1 UDP-N-acetylglucosamine 2-epimerase (non-hydrolyzing) [Candidatus Synechococcus calcipolaris G9]
MKIITIIGARPQFIKAAIVAQAMGDRPQIESILVHTGQHYDSNMSDVFFQELAIPDPHYHLHVGSGSHGVQTGEMLAKIEQVLLTEKPHWVLVYGDTNSTLAGAIAAVKLHIPIAHVEAGLRSFNRRMPEEINRILTDHSADVLFAPTATAVEHLIQEGIPPSRIYQVGDVMYDAALYYGEKAYQTSPILRDLQLPPKGYILTTVHRAENTDHPTTLAAIIQGLAKVARDQAIPVVWPVHPRTRKALEHSPWGAIAKDSLTLIDPVGYLDMLMLEKNARLLATDSGGMQKEAFFYHVPCVTLREETEWVELVELGCNFLVKTLTQSTIVETIQRALEMDTSTLFSAQPYGQGKASQRILDVLEQ